MRISGRIALPLNVGDPERREHLVLHEEIKPLSRDALNDSGEEIGGFVVVKELCAGIARELRAERELYKVRIAVDLRAGHRVGLQTRSLGEEMADGDLALP